MPQPQPLTPAQAEAYLARLPPDEICEKLRPHLTARRQARIEQVLAQRLTRLTVVVENLHDPHNGAAAIRSAEAIGLQDFHAVEQREAFRVAGGVTLHCEQWVTVHRHPDTPAAYRRLRAQGFVLWAAAPEGAVPFEEIPVDRPLALMFGNERDGLTEGAVSAADGTFAIPMHGFTGSFNLSVSVALATHAVAARVRHALGAPGDLPPGRLERLRALWYCLSVRAAGLILDEGTR
jgi:tRNA (guanosine-2'-O-)-methyltransferase